MSLVDKEADMIKKALKKHKGRRKAASEELGISERTLYRKIKELNLSKPTHEKTDHFSFRDACDAECLRYLFFYRWLYFCGDENGFRTRF